MPPAMPPIPNGLPPAQATRQGATLTVDLALVYRNLCPACREAMLDAVTASLAPEGLRATMRGYLAAQWGP